MAQIALNHVEKAYTGGVKAVDDLSLDVRDGEFMVFVGPSGCGKSTALRSIAGLEEITSGELKIAGEVVNDVPPSKRGIAMVFQSYALYPHMTVYDNMAFSMKIGKENKAEIDRRVRQAAEILQLTKYLDRLPKAMSGGQRQRVAIGRAIVRNPKVFLFDEPLSNLDAALRVATRIEIAKLKESMPNTTMIYVTHDQVEAMTLADRIVVLSSGRIEQVGTPLELYEHPRNLFVAGFIGSPKMNFIACELVEAQPEGCSVRTGAGALVRCAVDARSAQPGQPLTLGIRPEHFVVGAAAAAAASQLEVGVTFVESLGGSAQGYCSYPGVDDALTFVVDGRVRVKSGEPMRIGVPEEAAYLFDAQGLALKRLAAPLPEAVAA